MSLSRSDLLVRTQLYFCLTWPVRLACLCLFYVLLSPLSFGASRTYLLTPSILAIPIRPPTTEKTTPPSIVIAGSHASSLLVHTHHTLAHSYAHHPSLHTHPRSPTVLLLAPLILEPRPNNPDLLPWWANVVQPPWGICISTCFSTTLLRPQPLNCFVFLPPTNVTARKVKILLLGN